MVVTTNDIVTEEAVRRVVTEALEENLVYRQVYRNLDITGLDNDTITIPQDDDTLAEPKLIPEGTDFPREEEGVSTITATVAKYGNEIPVTMEAEDDSVFDIVAFQVEKKARKMQEKLNELAYTNLNSNLHANSAAGDNGGTLTWDDVVDGLRELEASGANPDLFITTPQGIEDLRTDTTYMNRATAASDELVRSGQVDRVAGLDVVMDNDGHIGNTVPDGFIVDTDRYGFEVMKGSVGTDEYEDPSRQARIFQIWTRVVYKTDDATGAIKVQG